MPWCHRVCARRVARLPLLIAGIASLFVAAPSRTVADAPLPLLTNAQQILDLGPDVVRRSSYPAPLRGVVTFAVEGSPFAFVQDATAGIQVIYKSSATSLPAGQLVEVDGVAGGAVIAPMLVDAEVRILGSAPMPEPRRVPAARLAGGDSYGQWVAIEGVVRDVAWNVGRRILFISSGGLRFHAVMQPCPDASLPTNWIDARVELRGVCSPDVDRESKPIGFTLYMPGTNEITFVSPKSIDPFHQPALSVKSDPKIHHQSDDRLKVAGTVLYQSPGGTIYLRTDTGAVEARLLVPLAHAGPKGRYLDRPPLPSLCPGTRVEVVGAPTEVPFAPVLHDAQVRIVGIGSVPGPSASSDSTLLSGESDRDLVRVKARLLTHALRESGAARYEALMLQSGDAIFEVVTAAGASNGLPALPQDAYVQAIGLCLMQPGDLKRSFRLLIRNPDELRVIGHCSAWRSPAAAKIALIAAAFGLAPIGWIWSLRRRVARGTSEFAQANRCF